ncbi:MAG: hypothetical protein P1V20_16480 [Verrucomicrobiales bacterium]|nr:hypothetical protein [Verrucomicrobiales bacterium]
MNLRRDWAGGIIAGLITLTGAWAVGQVTDGKALDLLGGMLPSVRFLCGSVMTATATVLTLILTLISFTSSREKQLRGEHYDKIRLIAKLACTGFIGSIVLLLIITLPIGEAPEKVYPFLQFFYYFVLISSCALGGLLVTIVLKLYQAATTIIIIVHPEKDNGSLVMEENQDAETAG